MQTIHAPDAASNNSKPMAYSSQVFSRAFFQSAAANLEAEINGS
jgi:hypothetical protein